MMTTMEIVVDELHDLVAAFFQRARRKRRGRAATRDRASSLANQEPLFSGTCASENSLVSRKPRGDRAAEPFGVRRIGLLRDGDVAREECL
jgi:hypothetical protein